ncbi:V-type immunoglobulin domain-containing suppressor of T-cell activation isoform X2 [Ambystoma mexicanum]|uniref:V-type immunoglobulin domain-containing suppressor of T-cell activation isoform X2 n=1 Tax=Ambystoma mexicanum TaxID=8296 RepID=UPI0037E8945C
MASDRESGHLIFRLWSSSLATCLLLAALQDHVSAFQISALHGLYICPEGQNVSLICKISGSLIDKHDLVGKVWFFSKHKEPNCVDKKHIRNVTEKELHFKNSSRYGVESTSDHHGTVRLTLTHLTMLDSGGYCCKVEEFKRDHGKTSVKQFSHGYMELQVKPAEKVLQNCTFHSFASEDNARAHELVRMDSNAQGIENPVFDEAPGGTAQPKPRLNFMASRQPSESGRHLLSEPNTPLSPPAIGDLFFPSLEPVPDSPPSTIVKI